MYVRFLRKVVQPRPALAGDDDEVEEAAAEAAPFLYATLGDEEEEDDAPDRVDAVFGDLPMEEESSRQTSVSELSQFGDYGEEEEGQ